MIVKRKIELLAPAKDLQCGIEAINHGADAVYIGAPKFGARAAACNTLEDISVLVDYAHMYNAHVYVTVNTILKDEELKDTESMIHDLYRVGVDALIVQDMGITKLNLPPIPLHASTQMDTRTADKVDFLYKAGFQQVVLARELTLKQIQQIHTSCPDVSLEVFVHGALCVSYSGQCYVSQACFGRSANRGECAQFCRLPFNLVDASGKLIVKNKHLLSLKDLNQLDELENILDAGATSLKIEGRLKDVTYVKNVIAAYRQKLDAIFDRREEYVRASSGKTSFLFTPQVDKSFSRGFTHYFLYGRTNDISSFDTPKSLGEEMGIVKFATRAYITVNASKAFHNGDGACFIDEKGNLKGFRINRVDGDKIYPLDAIRIQPKTKIYRNSDQEFDKTLAKNSAVRRISVDILFSANNFGYTLQFTDEDGVRVARSFVCEKQKARTPQVDRWKDQLCKLGNTLFEVRNIQLEVSQDDFIPLSHLGEWRRCVVEELERARKINYHRDYYKFQPTKHAYPVNKLTYLGNIMNASAAAFYKDHGVQSLEPAYEKQAVDGATLMFCKHCIRYSMGWCPVRQKKESPYKEPYYLVSTDGKRFKLTFDCKNCQMKVSQSE